MKNKKAYWYAYPGGGSITIFKVVCNFCFIIGPLSSSDIAFKIPKNNNTLGGDRRSNPELNFSNYSMFSCLVGSENVIF